MMWNAVLTVVLVARWVTPKEYECSLWIAPSHTGTKKKPKYGIFAGRDYRQNETLPLAELAIPWVDFIDSHNRRATAAEAILEFVESNMWTSEYAGSGWEGNVSAPVVIPGIGVLPQYHTGISNVNFYQESVLLRDRPNAPKAGTPHPSRGAITPYYNVTLMATRNIPAGMELFADFGDVWDGNYTKDEFQDTIGRHDYQTADKIIQELVDLYEGFPDLTLDFQEDILDYVLDKVLGVAAGKHAKTIKSLIPENPRRLQTVLKAGGSFQYRYPDMIHSTEWFSKNGYCLDTLRSGQSAIPYAGRGALATRDFKKDQLVSLSPMLHIADKGLMTMYPLKAEEDPSTHQIVTDYDREAGPIGQQLLLNYCFGHPESSILLFPLGSHVGLINHQSKANAYLTWARVKDNGLANNHKYHDVSPSDLADVDRVVVVMKVVALRDIAEDEEVTIDYGAEWLAAWEEYMVQWESSIVRNQPHPFQAADVQEEYRHKPFQTSETIAANPYPPNIATACFLRTRERPDGLPSLDEQVFIMEWYETTETNPYEQYMGDELVVVDVLERFETGDDFFFNYTVLTRASPKSLKRVLNVPHKACTFISRPYTSDIHLAGAFRHSIGILDNAFPQAWRDQR